MIRLFVEGVGLCGPGLPGWGPSRAVLAGTMPYLPAPTVVPPATLLPANERRRAVLSVKIALAAGAEAFAAAGRDPAGTATVFTSSGGDGETIHEILGVLASPARELSPTRFHNSVHNAASGYWSIATGSRAASTSLCCHDDSFGAGLLETAAQVAATRLAVALIAYDVRYPAPLGDVRRLGAAFAVALLLAPQAGPAAIAVLDLDLLAEPGTTTTIATPALEALRRNTPAARALPVLAAIAGGTNSAVTLDHLEDQVLALKVQPA